MIEIKLSNPNVRTIRRHALKQVRLLGNIELKGALAASRIGFRAMSATIAAFKSGTVFPPEAFAVQVVKAEPILTRAKMLAYLEGVRAGMQSAKRAKQDVTLAETFEREIDFTAKSLGITIETITEIEAAYAVESAVVLEATGSRVQAAILETLVATQQAGLHVRGGVRALRDTFEAQGITPRSSATFETIFRTEIQKANSAGRWQFNQKPEIQNALWGFRYVTAGDARVRPTHRGLEGVTLPKDHPRWKTIYPPNGYNCRCQAIELFDPPESEVPVPEKFTTVEAGRSVTVVPGADPGFDVNFGEVFPTPDQVRF